MTLTYYKRFRMEIDLNRRVVRSPSLPDPYFWVPWQSALIDVHAEVKCQSFASEIDSEVFPCLGDHYGCRQLMREITARQGFLPEATWLIACPDPEGIVHCGTVQAVVERGPVGAIQNLGVIPEHRGRRLGQALLAKALEGFRLKGVSRAYLEVTSGNLPAIRLYQSLGFRTARTVYKAVEAAVVG